ncbi:hypothetical protein M378DRAFT_284351 [Amanita muscaria Koide BX008]|uniref:Uncharacterized protein n=1 Tax=Amanita muscaria (strain Koide BX008) TaxID=946122 RepID=A0A0C2SY36_AMAMK|nr:hypothetical protein M378DRAFT_284351 [Amanita muscaria Koide BX008]
MDMFHTLSSIHPSQMVLPQFAVLGCNEKQGSGSEEKTDLRSKPGRRAACRRVRHTQSQINLSGIDSEQEKFGQRARRDPSPSKKRKANVTKPSDFSDFEDGNMSSSNHHLYHAPDFPYQIYTEIMSQESQENPH